MRERHALARADMVGRDNVDQRQTEDVFVEMARFLRVPATVSGVMQAENGRGGLAGHVCSCAAVYGYLSLARSRFKGNVLPGDTEHERYRCRSRAGSHTTSGMCSWPNRERAFGVSTKIAFDSRSHREWT